MGKAETLVADKSMQQSGINLMAVVWICDVGSFPDSRRPSQCGGRRSFESIDSTFVPLSVGVPCSCNVMSAFERTLTLSNSLKPSKGVYYKATKGIT